MVHLAQDFEKDERKDKKRTIRPYVPTDEEYQTPSIRLEKEPQNSTARPKYTPVLSRKRFAEQQSQKQLDQMSGGTMELTQSISKTPRGQQSQSNS